MRIAFYDIETTGLKASFSQMLCMVGGELNTQTPLHPIMTELHLDDFTTPQGRCDDRGLALRAKEYLEQFDLVIGYNSIQFDLKFINTRLAKYGLPGVRLKRHKDLYYVMRYKFLLQSNSLRNAARYFFGETIKTELSLDKWRLAHAGDLATYLEVIEHCAYDVLELARLWSRVASVAGELK